MMHTGAESQNWENFISSSHFTSNGVLRQRREGEKKFLSSFSNSQGTVCELSNKQRRVNCMYYKPNIESKRLHSDSWVGKVEFLLAAPLSPGSKEGIVISKVWKS